MIRFFIFLISTFSIDRLLKYWVGQNFEYLTLSKLNNPIFDIMFVKNKGIAFSLLENNPSIIKLVSIFFILASIYYILKNKKKLNNFSLISWGILLGGVFGNLYDRFAYNFVIDYIKLKFIDFPVMNLADIAINFGIISLIVLIYLNKEFKNAK